MPTVNARVGNQMIVDYTPHTSVDGETWQLIKRGTCTSNGAAGGTTLIDTSSDSGGADTYNGRYWVKILSGSCKGAWCRVIDDNGSGTLTFEDVGFEAQIDSGVEYEIWQDPCPVVVVDSSSGETNMVDTYRTEADDFWNGYYAVPLTGSHRGKIAQITDFTSSGGVFVLAASFGSALAAGDVVRIVRFIESTKPQLPQGEPYFERLSKRVNFSAGDGVVGARDGSLSFNTDVLASGTLQDTTNTAANPSILSGLFEACGLEEQIGKTMVAGAGGTTTAVTVATGTHEYINIGQMIVHIGNVSFVTAKTDGGGAVDTLTVSPPLPQAPTSGDKINGSRTYKPTTDGDVLGATVCVEIDGVRTYMTGCKGNVSLTSGPKPAFAWSFSVDHWIRQVMAAPFNPGAAYSNARPVLERDRIAYLDTTRADISGFTCSANVTVAPKDVAGRYGVNGRAGYHVTDVAPGGSFRELLESGSGLDADLAYTARTSKSVAVIMGTHGDTVAIRMPVARLVESPHPGDAGGLVDVPRVLRAHDAGVASDPTAGVVKVPDFAIHIV